MAQGCDDVVFVLLLHDRMIGLQVFVKKWGLEVLWSNVSNKNLCAVGPSGLNVDAAVTRALR